MEKLAIAGGQPVFAQPPALPPWPPADSETGDLLRELYLSRQWSFHGRYEQEFAAAFAGHHHAAYGVFMVNGTTTLECALQALGVGPGDEVIVPSWTWLATGVAPRYVGATPVFVDGEPDTFCLDPAAFEAAITPRTRAVIPVHLFGSMADLDRITAIARKHNIAVIEDCAHAHGGMWRDQGVGSFGAIGSFSFQQTKLMTAGEGGLCLTSDSELQEKLFRLKHIGYMAGARQGQASGPPPEGLLCHNYRATEFQALILNRQLATLQADTAKRAAAAEYLRREFSAIPGIAVQAPGRHATLQSYYVYAVTVDPARLKPGKTRDDVIAALQAEGVPEVFAGWGAPVYGQKLWNIPARDYRIHSGATIEAIINHRIMLFSLMWLMAGESALNRLVEALAKVMKEYAR